MKPDVRSIIRKSIFAAAKAGHRLVPLLSSAAIKAGGDLGGILSEYSGALMDALRNYTSGGMGMVEARNDFKQAMVAAFDMAFEAGYVDGGGDLPTSAEAGSWLGEREDAEVQHIEDLFFTFKQWRQDNPDGDVGSWISDRSGGYTASLNDVYSMGEVFGAGEQPLTLDGDDGAESCETCQELKGQTHPASWWIENDLVPYQGNTNYVCGCWGCRHGLKDKSGRWVTLNPDTYKIAVSPSTFGAVTGSDVIESLPLGDTASNLPPQIQEDPANANRAWLKDNDPRLSLYATGVDEDGSPMSAYVVDGPVVRNNIWQDFTAGGNHSRYPWIPEHEYWLDVSNASDLASAAEADFDLVHETAEDRKMRDTGADYSEAHSKVANVLEFAARHDGRAREILKQQGWQKFHPIPKEST
jgi:hypothetical protein